jgi:hypothetical protein
VFIRDIFSIIVKSITECGALAEQLRRGLQNLVDGCNSHTCLHYSNETNPEGFFSITRFAKINLAIPVDLFR